MRRTLSLEYWIDDGWYVGHLKEVPGIFSQGATLEDLEENIRDAYREMMADAEPAEQSGLQVKEIELEVSNGSTRFVS